MKKWLVLLSAIFAITIIGITDVRAITLGTNITQWDGLSASSGSTWYTTHAEDQEVEPGNVASQTWDLEGFYLKGSKLSLVGGFNFKGVPYNGDTFYSGDIFIDVGGGFTSPAPVTTNSNGYVNVSSNFGYEYVLDLNFTTMKYDIIKLDGSANGFTDVVLSCYYGSNGEANPYRYVTGGTTIETGISFDYFNNLTDADVGGLLGGTHYAIAVDLGFLGNGTAFNSHFAEGCGNDFMTGQGVVPIPGSVLLLGSGLVGLVVLGRRRKRR